MEHSEQQAKEEVNKKPYFFWTKELVAEFAHEVALQYKISEIWTGDDLGAEKGMVDNFIKRKHFEEIHKGLIISDAGQTLIVSKEKLEELIKFLFNYRDGF